MKQTRLDSLVLVLHVQKEEMALFQPNLPREPQAGILGILISMLGTLGP